MSRSSVVLLLVGVITSSWPWEVSAAGLLTGQAREAGFSVERLERLQGLLDDLVAREQIAGGSVLIARHGRAVYQATSGMRDAETQQPMTEDTILRIASMTKPITSVAVMMLVDEGQIRLDDPVATYLPEFAAPRVLVSPESDDEAGDQGGVSPTVAAERPITIHHLLTHTSGIPYRFRVQPRLAELYVRAAVSDGLAETPGTIAHNTWRIAQLPLANQPGAAWEYGLSTDVLGRLIEVVSGQTLEEFFHERIFEPLRMTDTHFRLPRAKRDRLAAVYTPGDDQTIQRVGHHPVQVGPLVYSATYPTWDDGTYFSGGAGLVSTLGDYARFLQMLLNRGELDGVRLLQSETVDRMTRHQLGDLRAGPIAPSDGFGYGFGVVLQGHRDDEPAATDTYYWGGFFQTYFWVDPDHELIGLLMTQLYPSTHLTIRQDVKRLTYEALAD